MQRKQRNTRNVKRHPSSYPEVRSGRGSQSVFGRGTPKKQTIVSGSALSNRSRRVEQPLLVGENVLKKLNLQTVAKPAGWYRKLGFNSSASALSVITAVIVPTLLMVAWQTGVLSISGGSKLPPAAAVATTDGLAPTIGIPSEKLPVKDKGGFSGVKVAFDQPDRILIDKLGVSAQVRNLGSGVVDQLMFPGNIYDLGWYNKSALPGGQNTILLDGYSEGPTKKGTLYGADQLKTGDQITIVRGDGVRLNYKFSDSRVYTSQNKDLTEILKSHPGHKQILALAVAQSGSATQSNNVRQISVFFAELE